MICIYHSKDLDGYCSGAIVKLKYPDSKLIGFDYGQELPMDEIPEGEPIIMIDVSLPMKQMENLARHSGWKLTWIDHHISSINDYKKFVGNGETFCHAVLEDGISACEGGWKYLFPKVFMPTAVKLLGEYDTWRNSDKQRWDNAIMPFQYGMRMICSSPETFPSDLFKAYSVNDIETDSPVYNIIHDGKLILEYQKVQNERACRSAFEIEFEGLRAITLNNGGANSQVFESVYDENKHDIMIPFFFTGTHWTFSMYTTKDEIDCSVIAKSKGGGGHKKAAGFQLKELPDEFKINLK
jgi:oligoribonuclease NrnB/cAMP/cGMP phosphodiesterase (DHH superfamily)